MSRARCSRWTGARRLADDPSAIPHVLHGAVDLYVHASPDLLPRQADDHQLVALAQDAGLAGAVHRHHFVDTTTRGALASTSGFALLGALVLNDVVGGVNPAAVEAALRLGCAWVGLPTLSTRAFRAQLGGKPGPLRDVLGLGPGRISLVDETGALRPEVAEVVALAGEYDVPLGWGYGDAKELVALVGLLRSRSQRSVLTYPHMAGLGAEAVASLLEGHEAYVEICAYRLHPAGPIGGNPAGVQEALALVSAVGAERCILSSDGGMSGAPAVPDLLRWGVCALAEAGLEPAVLRRMTHVNPRRVLGARAPA